MGGGAPSKDIVNCAWWSWNNKKKSYTCRASHTGCVTCNMLTTTHLPVQGLLQHYNAYAALMTRVSIVWCWLYWHWRQLRLKTKIETSWWDGKSERRGTHCNTKHVCIFTFESLCNTLKICRQHLGPGVGQFHHLSELLWRGRACTGLLIWSSNHLKLQGYFGWLETASKIWYYWLKKKAEKKNNEKYHYGFVSVESLTTHNYKRPLVKIKSF